jgi:hypothetical protein
MSACTCISIVTSAARCAVVGALLLHGCGSDEDDDDDHDEAGAQESDAGSERSAVTEPSADLTGDGCLNSADRRLLTENWPTVQERAAMCTTITCIRFISDPRSDAAFECFVQCMDSGLRADLDGDSLSEACLPCTGQTALCSLSEEEDGEPACSQVCLPDPMSVDCNRCLCSSHPNGVAPGRAGDCAIDAFADCAGFRPTRAEVGCD